MYKEISWRVRREKKRKKKRKVTSRSTKTTKKGYTNVCTLEEVQ